MTNRTRRSRRTTVDRNPDRPKRRGSPGPGTSGTRKLGFFGNNSRKLRPFLTSQQTAIEDRASRRHPARREVPLGTRKLELARQQATTALRGRRPTKAEITPAKHPTGAPDGRCLLALGMGLPGEILAEKTNSRAGGEGTNRAMTE